MNSRISLLMLTLSPILMVSPVYAQSGFIASPTNSSAFSQEKSTDPIYNTYHNLALGFSIEYLKNMTLSQLTDKISAFDAIHFAFFESPHIGSINFKGIPHLVGFKVVVASSTGAFGPPLDVEDAVRHLLLALADNSTRAISEARGSLNSLPAYRIEFGRSDNPVNFTRTTAEIPYHDVMYVSVKDRILYELEFVTYDKNIQTNFIPTVNRIVDSFQYN
jgi:hypothetical protein